MGNACELRLTNREKSRACRCSFWCAQWEMLMNINHQAYLTVGSVVVNESSQ